MEFDQLPDELLFQIFLELDIDSILPLFIVDKNFNSYCLEKLIKIVRIKMDKITRFNTNIYGLQELYNIYRLLSADISAGVAHSLLVNTKGLIYSFGSNIYGQLGLGYNDMILFSDKDTKSDLDSDLHNCYWDLGDDFDIQSPTVIPNLNNVGKVYAGSANSFVLTKDGNLYGFGSDPTVQFTPKIIIRDDPTMIHNVNDIKDIINSSLEISHGLHDYDSYKDDIDLICDWNGHDILKCNNAVYSRFNYKVEFDLPNIIKMVNNRLGLIILTAGGEIVRLRIRGTASKIDHLSNIIDISGNGDYCLFLDSNGKVYCWGKITALVYDVTKPVIRKFKIPTIIDSLNNIIRISANKHHALMLDCYGMLYSIGCNIHGQLGLNDRINRSIPTQIPNFNLL